MKALVLAAWVGTLMLAPSVARSATAGSDHDVLRGLRTVDLLVERMNGDALAAGFDPKQYLHDTEVRLHEAGLRVQRTDAPDDDSSSAVPCLYLRVSAMLQPEEHLTVYSIGLEMFEQVHVARLPDVFALGSIWRAHERLGKLDTDHLSVVRDNVKDVVDEFIDAWLAANAREAMSGATTLH
jgi:hypothetical protein